MQFGIDQIAGFETGIEHQIFLGFSADGSQHKKQSECRGV
jgi:hypothetical protein